jgi:ABC-2 type transport system permease protein
MMCRLPYDVPMSELVFSIVLLFATALGITYLAGKIYRTGILMYGRKFSFAEILRWMQRKE